MGGIASREGRHIGKSGFPRTDGGHHGAFRHDIEGVHGGEVAGQREGKVAPAATDIEDAGVFGQVEQKLPGGAGFVGRIMPEVTAPLFGLVLERVLERLCAAIAYGRLDNGSHFGLREFAVVVIRFCTEVGNAVRQRKGLAAALTRQGCRRPGQTAKAIRTNEGMKLCHEAKLTRVRPRLVKKIRYTAPK